MSKVKWDKDGERLYETGVDKGVLYLLKYNRYQDGTPWNGLVNVTDSSSGAEPSAFYADNRKYLNLISDEELGLTIEAFTYPNSFNSCLGKKELAKGVLVDQQRRAFFGFSYRTLIGNDTQGNDYGYKIHFVYGCFASASESSHDTVNENPDAMTNSWDISTTPVDVPGNKPTARITISSVKLIKAGLFNFLKKIEDTIYGTDTTNPSMPLPVDIVNIMEDQMYLRDSNNQPILDSGGLMIRTVTYD